VTLFPPGIPVFSAGTDPAPSDFAGLVTGVVADLKHGDDHDFDLDGARLCGS